jgi:phosphate butyryltransferase
MSENRTYDEIEIGDRAALTRVCSENDLIVFAHASGNLNPLHLPKTDGVPTEGSETVAPSMWAGSLFSAVLGNVLPGIGSLYRAQSLRFERRAHVGDELTIEVVAREKRSDRVVLFDCTLTNQRGEQIAYGEAEVIAPAKKLVVDVELPELFVRPHQHFKRVIDSLAGVEPMKTAVVCPDDDNSLGGALLSHREELIQPVLVGDEGAIRAAAERIAADLTGIEIIDVIEHEAAAARAVALIGEGRAEAIMKGNIHSDEILRAVLSKSSGLRTSRRISHCFVLDVPGLDHLLIISDAAINISPDLAAKVDIVQNAIDVGIAIGMGTPHVGILSAVETVNPAIPSTLDAAILSKMADRGQIRGGMVDGPLAMDNAIDIEAAKTKGIRSLVAGRADILIVPNLESGNMLAKELTFVANADAAGLVVGTKVPVMLTSRADDEQARLASCAIAQLYAAYQRDGSPLIALPPRAAAA